MARKGWALMALALMTVAGCKTMTGETAGQNVDDSAITASVKSRLARQETMGTLTQINVKTIASTVYLTGIAKSEQERQQAEDIAGQVNWVRKVVNNIVVQS